MHAIKYADYGLLNQNERTSVSLYLCITAYLRLLGY